MGKYENVEMWKCVDVIISNKGKFKMTLMIVSYLIGTVFSM